MKKSTGIAFLCWLPSIIGICGVQRLYLGFYVTGILWLLTFGLFGFGQLVDLFRLRTLTMLANGELNNNVNANTNVINITNMVQPQVAK